MLAKLLGLILRRFLLSLTHEIPLFLGEENKEHESSARLQMLFIFWGKFFFVEYWCRLVSFCSPDDSKHLLCIVVDVHLGEIDV